MEHWFSKATSGGLQSTTENYSFVWNEHLPSADNIFDLRTMCLRGTWVCMSVFNKSSYYYTTSSFPFYSHS